VTFAVSLGRRPSARGVVAVGLVGLIVLGMAAAWIWPERVIAAAEKLMHVVRALGVRGAVVFAIVQILVAVSGILPAAARRGGRRNLWLGTRLLAHGGQHIGRCSAVVLSQPIAVPLHRRASGGPSVAAARPRRPDCSGRLEAGVPVTSLSGHAVFCGRVSRSVCPRSPCAITSQARLRRCRRCAAMSSSARSRKRALPRGQELSPNFGDGLQGQAAAWA